MTTVVAMLFIGLAGVARFAIDVLAVVVGLAIWNWWIGRRREQKS